MNPCKVPALLLFLVWSTNAQPLHVKSPDGKLDVGFNLAASVMTWSATYKGAPLLLDSQLGMSLYSGAYELVKHTSAKHEGQWSPVYGERKTIPDNYNELTIEVKDKAAPFRPLQIILRAYNEGAAMRYRFPGTGPVLFLSEYTGFHLPASAQAYEEHGTEGEYKKVPVAAILSGCERPLTVNYGGNLYAAIGEAANTDYPRMLLSPVKGKADTLISDLGGSVKVTAPYATPWRFLVVGERPGDLLERNYLVLNLNPPSVIKDTSWIKPGKVIREVTLSTKGGKEAIDFAVQRGLQYIEYDAGWYGFEYEDASDATRVSLDPRRVAAIPDHGGLNLQEVIEYGKQRGIGVLLYVNRRALERQADELFPLFRKWGVKGVKFGFVNVGPQEWTTWLHDAIRKAGDNHLLVDVHDGYRPSGVTRTYPNLLTQEGIRGNEHMPTAEHNTIVPFTRFIAGPADYTVCYYSDRIQTTRSHQLALPVVYYSPLQFLFWYDKPSAYQGEPEVEFFKNVPTVWDDTKVIDGRIGEFVSVARKSGDKWFLGSITNGQAREITIPLTFLKPNVRYAARLYNPGAGKHDVKIENRVVDSTTTLSTYLPAATGQAIWIRPE